MAKARADVLLVARGFFESRAKARAAIEAGRVAVDGRTLAKPADLIDQTAAIAAEPAHPWVGRGALKLVHALEIWPVSPKGRIVLDVGASTGGFTQVCLARGAERVFAVDVGRGQLHASLATDPRVTSLEATDARALTADLVPSPPDLVVCDVSFISLTKALPAALALAAVGADLIALVKPQFESGPEAIGKGGLVKDAEAHARALATASDFLDESGWTVRATADSPILGGEGAREHLVWAQKRPPTGR